MIETSLMAGQLAEGAMQQQLPPAQHQDVSRFQDLMTGNAQGSSTAIQPQAIDSSSVLQFVEPGQSVEPSTGLVDNLINQASKIDGQYHSLIDQMANRPNIDDYFKTGGETDIADQMLTYPNVPKEVDSGDSSSKMEKVLTDFQDNSSKAISYQSDMNAWAMSFRMWSAGVEVVSAAASKVSQGFQTLFRASG